jgi:hypothetical protein
MDKVIRIGLATPRTLHLIMAVSLLVLAGRAFNANAQTVTKPDWFTSPSKGTSQTQTRPVQGSDANSYEMTIAAGQQLPPGRLLPPGKRLPLGRQLPPGGWLPRGRLLPPAKPVNYELPSL